MQHGSIRAKNEQMILLINSDTPNPSVSLFKVSGLSLIACPEIIIASATNVIDTIYKFMIQSPDEDCYIFIKSAYVGEIIKVGHPDMTFFTMTTDFTEGEVINYSRVDFNGTIIEEGTLHEYGQGLYGIGITDHVNDCFLNVGSSNNYIIPRTFLGTSNTFAINYRYVPYTTTMKTKQLKFKINSIDERNSIIIKKKIIER